MTHLSIVRDIPFSPETKVVANLWLPGDEVEVDAAGPAFLLDDEDDKRHEQIEDKVVKSRRGRRPMPPTVGVETK